MSDEPSNPDWLLERISNLNGQVVASGQSSYPTSAWAFCTSL